MAATKGHVEDASQDFNVKLDNAIAHRMQDSEWKEYYEGNIQRNKFARESAKVARRLQSQQDEEIAEMRAQNQAILRSDSAIADEIQTDILRQDTIEEEIHYKSAKVAQEMQDEEYALYLQKKEEERLKKKREQLAKEEHEQLLKEMQRLELKDGISSGLTVDLESGESERQIEKDEEYARALEERSREEAEKERREHLLALQRQDEELAKQLQEKEELKAKKLREKLQQEQQQRQRAAQEAEAPASTTSPTGSNPTLFAYRPPTAIQAKEGAAPGEAVPVTRQNYKRGSTTRKK
ncbi:coiled-coil domain-containing protein 50-like [Oscarella lobularis]|uniref:coiled-coil domain-containing protein 50-like n=1 Tax=Oscarella lobularis TaxID=121494 RepID=UPI003313D4E8